MTERERYCIYVDGILVDVTPEVYYAYYRAKRQEKYQEEKKVRYGICSYDALDEDGMLGVEMFADTQTLSMDDLLVREELYQQLHQAMSFLLQRERELIEAIYYHDIPQSEYAMKIGVSVKTVNNRRRKILLKLKNYLEYVEHIRI